MTAVPDPGITVVNHYRLTAGREAFVAAVTALARRVQVEGHPGVLEYRFHCPPGSSEGHAVVRYLNADAWIGHHDLAMGWPEMAALRASADLAEVALFGPFTPTMRDWCDRMGLADKVRHHGEPVAGFRR
jgi:hypothetical protein